MKRLLLIAAVLLWTGSAWAQKIVTTTISAEPCGWFLVDGVQYEKFAIFLWPEGSKHTLAIGEPYLVSTGIICGYPNMQWTNSLETDLPSTTVITASADVTSYTLGSGYLYQVTLDLNNPPAQGAFSCVTPSAGKVIMEFDGESPDDADNFDNCYSRSTSVWARAGEEIKLQAQAPAGYVFVEWAGHLQGLTSSEVVYTVNGPIVVVARFEPAASVTVRSEPSGLKLLIDRTPIETPHSFDWRYGSTHALAPMTPQMGSDNTTWVFDSWEHGGEAIQAYTLDYIQRPVTLTAKFVPGARVSYRTEPLGLKLVVDGRQNWQGYNFEWAVGSTHTVAAPVEQFDEQGRKYVFVEWASGAAPEHEITVGAPGDQQGDVARYELLGRLTVETSHPEATVLIDGEPCGRPCTIHRRAGGIAKVAASASIPAGEDVRLDLQSASDGGGAERDWTATSEAATLTFRYNYSYRLLAVSDPADGARLVMNPSSADGYYAEGTEVNVAVESKPGYKFLYWEGDLDGIARSGTVWVNEPAGVLAKLERVPFIAEAGVRNAAGERPDPAVAPGSIISIFGGGLAKEYMKGPENMLAQVIDGITVLAGDRILPLFYVSPEQINALLPSDFPEGEHTLTVSGEEQPDITAKFTVRRNAPGLFGQAVETKEFAVASHTDGSPVTLESPAAQGEMVTLLGTGFGPYVEGALDGFVIPDGLEFKLADAVEIRIGDQVITPESAKAANGYAGMQAIRFRITDAMPAASSLEVKVSVNGQESNSVLLPLK